MIKYDFRQSLVRISGRIPVGVSFLPMAIALRRDGNFTVMEFEFIGTNGSRGPVSKVTQKAHTVYNLQNLQKQLYTIYTIYILYTINGIQFTFYIISLKWID